MIDVPQKDQALVHQALIALGGFACGECGQHVDVATGDVVCRACGCAHCPYCAQPSEHSCEHLLAAVVGRWSRKWSHDLFASTQLPFIRARGQIVDWSESQKQEAFGGLKPLLAAYQRSLLRLPEPLVFFELLMRALPTPARLVRRSWRVRETPSKTFAEACFVPNPVEARRDAAALLDRLAEAFARLSRVTPESERHLRAAMPWQGTAARHLAFSGRGTRLAVAGVRGVRVWDSSSARLVGRLDNQKRIVRIAFDDSGGTVVARGDWTERRWASATGRLIDEEPRRPIGTERYLGSSTSDGRVRASTGPHGTVTVSDAASTEAITQLRSWHGVSLAAVSDDRALLAAAGPSWLTVWQLGTGNELWSRREHVSNLLFSPDSGSLLTVGRELRILDSATGEVRATLVDRLACQSIFFWDADTVAIVNGGTLSHYGAATGKLLRRVGTGGQRERGCLSPDRRVFAGTDGRTVRLWDTATFEEVARLDHALGVTSLAFSPDSDRLATADAEGSALVWAVPTTTESWPHTDNATGSHR